MNLPSIYCRKNYIATTFYKIIMNQYSHASEPSVNIVALQHNLNSIRNNRTL